MVHWSCKKKKKSSNKSILELQPQIRSEHASACVYAVDTDKWPNNLST